MVSCPPDLSAVAALLKSNTPPLLLPLQHESPASHFYLDWIERGLDNQYIVCVVLDIKYWSFLDNWNYTLNRFLARALGLDKREVLFFRFKPHRATHCTSRFYSNKRLLQIWLSSSSLLAQVHVMPGIECNSFADMMPFFVNDEMEPPLSFLLTEYIFFECSRPNQYEESEFRIYLNQPTVRLPDSQLPDRLYGRDAILLEHLKHDNYLIAIPWRSRSNPSSPEKVRSYIAKVYRWCWRRMKNKHMHKPFPSSVLTFNHPKQHYYLKVKQWVDKEQCFDEAEEAVWFLAGENTTRREKYDPNEFFFPQ